MNVDNMCLCDYRRMPNCIFALDALPADGYHNGRFEPWNETFKPELGLLAETRRRFNRRHRFGQPNQS